VSRPTNWLEVTRRRAEDRHNTMTAFHHGEYSEERIITIPGEGRTGGKEPSEADAANRARQLLTFRLDRDFRQRLRIRLARENRSLSDVVIFGLQLYIQQSTTSSGRIPAAPGQMANALTRQSLGEAPSPGTTAVASVADLALTGEVAVYLRDLRSCGQSELLSATLARLYDVGWPLRPLAAALGISRQAVRARIRQQVPPEVRSRVPDVPPPSPFPRRRSALTGGRPHFTVKIDRALRTAAHHQAQHEGSSLSQVIERILDYYLRHGLSPDEIHLGDTTPTRPAARRKRGVGIPTAEADHAGGE
jgi:hypothetical protein